jgi:tetratricopeptide (TPR) repeat protein
VSSEYQKVEALLALGRAGDAASLIERLPAREAPTPEYLRLRGRALRAAGRVFDAEASFREALAGAPQDPALLADLATTLLGQRRLTEAIGYAREAVSLRPDVAAWHCLLGVVAEDLGHLTEAGAALQTARVLAPTDAEAHVVYGWHALRRGLPAEADEAFRTALSLTPGRAEALRGLARARAEAEDWAGARAAWLDALAVDPMQRDRVLARALVLGNPALKPLVRLARVPVGVSVGSLLAGLAALLAVPDTASPWSGALPGGVAVALCGTFLALAAAGPLARAALQRSLRE